MKKLTGLVLAGVAMISAASAPAQTTPNTRLVSSITEADLVALVRAEGHTIDATHPFESPSVRGKTKDGLLFLLIGSACDKNGVPGCQGIMMQVRYDENSSVTTAGINKSNLNEAALSAWWDEADDTVGFTRYVVLDDGVTWMNIRQNLRILLSIQDNAYDYVFK